MERKLSQAVTVAARLTAGRGGGDGGDRLSWVGDARGANARGAAAGPDRHGVWAVRAPDRRLDEHRIAGRATGPVRRRRAVGAVGHLPAQAARPAAGGEAWRRGRVRAVS